MLTNDQMKPNRFGKLARGRRLIKAMNAAWDADRTVFVSTYTNVTKIAPKHRDLVKMDAAGSIFVQRGKRADCIDFCKITVSA